jgi:hypothetical protein
MEQQQSSYRPPAAKGTTMEQQGRLQRRMLRRRMSVVEGMSDGDAPLGAMLARAVGDSKLDLVPKARSENTKELDLVPKPRPEPTAPAETQPAARGSGLRDNPETASTKGDASASRQDSVITAEHRQPGCNCDFACLARWYTRGTSRADRP